MATLKYSRQRESIKKYLLNTIEHPTADIVYLHVKKEYPNVSLGTVYRNLNLLADIGEAIKITTPYGGDRFDGRTHPHNHFICTTCDTVIDLKMDCIDYISDIASKEFDGLIESHTTFFYGICSNCVGKSKEHSKLDLKSKFNLDSDVLLC